MQSNSLVRIISAFLIGLILLTLARPLGIFFRDIILLFSNFLENSNGMLLVNLISITIVMTFIGMISAYLIKENFWKIIISLTLLYGIYNFFIVVPFFIDTGGYNFDWPKNSLFYLAFFIPAFLIGALIMKGIKKYKKFALGLIIVIGITFIAAGIMKFSDFSIRYYILSAINKSQAEAELKALKEQAKEVQFGETFSLSASGGDSAKIAGEDIYIITNPGIPNSTDEVDGMPIIGTPSTYSLLINNKGIRLSNQLTGTWIGIGSNSHFLPDNFPYVLTFDFTPKDENPRFTLYEYESYCETIVAPEYTDECFDRAARGLKDHLICERITAIETRDECFSNLAVGKADLCKKIEDLSVKNECYYNNVVKDKDASLCKEIQDDENEQSHCFEFLANEKKNPSLCTEVSIPAKGYCQYLHAIEKQDINECNYITSENEFESLCYFEIARAKGGIEVCTTITMQKELWEKAHESIKWYYTNEAARERCQAAFQK